MLEGTQHGVIGQCKIGGGVREESVEKHGSENLRYVFHTHHTSLSSQGQKLPARFSLHYHHDHALGG